MECQNIKIISQNTAERKEETKQLFLQCKPLLNKGLSLNKAVRIIKGINHHSFSRQKWFRDLKEYAESEGYFVKY